jgi:hypothetical protein
MRILLYGGHFDPITKGHIEIACFGRDYTNYDRVWFLPTYGAKMKKKIVVSSCLFFISGLLAFLTMPFVGYLYFWLSIVSFMALTSSVFFAVQAYCDWYDSFSGI